MENNQKKYKFIGLISGGKDSIFNILECVRHGHELVVLVNLYPAGRFKLYIQI